MTTASSPSEGLHGIDARFRGRATTRPRVRFAPTGEQLWQFSVRVDAHWTAEFETVVVRAPDQHYGALQKWVVPGKLLFLHGRLRLIRWEQRGHPRASLLLEVQELMPLEASVRGSEPAALDYTERRMPVARAIPPKTQAERAARVRTLLEETSMP